MRGESFKTWAFRHGLNLYPMFFGTGGKLLYLKGDWTHATVRLKLGLWTRNYVGTIFGGAMFAAADPFPMVLLMKCLGREFVVWDKAGHIDFKRPGREAIKADFIYTPEELDRIRSATLAQGSYEFEKVVPWVNAAGQTVSIVRKTLYVATKEHFNKKQAARAAR